VKTYKYKIRHDQSAKRLDNVIDISGMIYNHIISLHKRYYCLYGKYPNVYAIKKHITKQKKLDKNKFWNLVGSQAIQDICFRIDKGFKAFFDNQKKKSKRFIAPPTFKKVKKYKSFTLSQAGWGLISNGTVRIGKNIYRYHHSRDIQGKIKTVTVKRDTMGNFWLCFAVENEITEIKFAQGKTSGFDFGMKDFFLTSDSGEKILHPQFHKQALKDIKKANRNLSAKKKGSKSWSRAKRKLASVHARVARQRRDWFFKLAHQLCRENQAIFLEDLNIAGMQKLWGRKITDLAFAEFVNILHHVSTGYTTTVEHIDRWFPSSKKCSDCRKINHSLTLDQREWTCACGSQHDRDQNAGKNIKQAGQSSARLEVVTAAQAA
jgi:putative transposase